MDGTADGYVVTVTPEPVVAGGGAAEVAEAVVAEASAADADPLGMRRRLGKHPAGAFFAVPAQPVTAGQFSGI